MPSFRGTPRGKAANDLAGMEVTLEELEEVAALEMAAALRGGDGRISDQAAEGADMVIQHNQDYLKHVNAKYGQMEQAMRGGKHVNGKPRHDDAPKVTTVFKFHTTPLDFSFSNISSLEQVASIVPRAGPRLVLKRLAREKLENIAAAETAARAAEADEAIPPSQRGQKPAAEAELAEAEPEPEGEQAGEGEAQAEETEAAAGEAGEEKKPKAPPGQRRVELAGSTSLRLNNNELTTLEELPTSLGPVLLLPNRLQWLDLSFNQITHIEPIVAACPALRLLYLHVNAISEPKQLDCLKGLPFLHTLTLHGNAVENVPNYRFKLAVNLPALKSLDFSALTIVEKDKARTWAKGQEARRLARSR